MATERKLSKTELFLLNEVDSCPDKLTSLSALRRSAMRTLTSSGFSRVLDKMISDDLLCWTDDRKVTVTFGGLRALGCAQ